MTSALYTHNLFGTILSASTQLPLQDVSITVLNTDGTLSQLQTTFDFNGYYQVPTVPQGQRTVQYQKQNYQTIRPQIFMSNSDYQYNAQLLNKPGIPFNPSPIDGATNQPLFLTLSWSCTDPDGDALKYDVYFGTTNPPTQIVTQDQTTTILERVRFFNRDTNTEFCFITNNFAIPALTVAMLYKWRWKVELFFKWIKQHLRIKSFYGTSENAVKTQIWIAITVYVLIAIVKKQLKLQMSLYTFIQILSVNPFEKVDILQLVTENSCTESSNHSSKQLNLFD